MKTFEDYLFEQAYAPSTIVSYLRAKDKFLEWCEDKGYEMDTIDYKACLDYAKKLQEMRNGKSPSRKTVRHHIGALKILFNYLIDENYRGDNPMENMNIRGVKRSLIHNLLSFEELEDLYYSFPTRNIKQPSCPHVAVRDKVIIGLMVYQGLNATALKTLKMEHINLERGKIYVPGTRKTNARELEMKSPQILSLAQYVQEDREYLQDSIGCHSEAFIPLKGNRFSVITSWLFKKMRRINYNVRNAQQIRASVITQWLSHYNIRKVQYMAGHRYISSTEKYLQDDLMDLHELIDGFHPINQVKILSKFL